MLLAQAGCVFMGFILYISGAQGKQTSVCSLKGSSVDLPCSAEHPTSNYKWYTVHYSGSKHVQNELSADGNHMKYNISEKSNFTLTINDLRDNDTKNYCCSNNRDNPLKCWEHATKLQVTDLQVKVIPTTEGHTLTLMCSTSCRLPENPAAYTWYKNRRLIYSDWSPWYQELVSSEEGTTYSCAIKGYKDLRAPEVSLDSVTPACFSVTYAKGRMCSSKTKSEDEPCTITYPREVHIQRIPAATYVTLKCITSCPLTDPKIIYGWYLNRQFYRSKQQMTVSYSVSKDSFSCGVNDNVHSHEVCPEGLDCWSVNYVSRRICALEDSSVNILSKYSHPYNELPRSKIWYQIKLSDKVKTEEVVKKSVRVEYHVDNKHNKHNLRINNLTKNDSGEYTFKLYKTVGGWKQPDVSGVILIVTGLRVKITPSAMVTEGQTVTLTCSTSCPLTDNTNYIWYLNRRPVTLPLSQNKHLVLDPVSSQHAGNYSCAVKTHQTLISSEKTLTVQVQTRNRTPAAAAGVFALLVVIIICLWFRRKKDSSQPPRTDTSNIIEQLSPGPVNDDISAQTTGQGELLYSTVHFFKNHTHPLSSTIRPHQPREVEQVEYAVVNFRHNMIPERAPVVSGFRPHS
uniref:Uncharacterized LOC113128677 n=1 Tax=Mastacembelus armatus TaxID=205130 RepID=A0A7N8XYI5_9TELE